MNKLTTIAFLAFMLFSTSCLSQKDTIAKNELNSSIDGYIRKTMQTHQIPGLALAVIKEGQLIHKGYYGKASIEHNIPINENTIFRVYSTTKLITATGIFQLIERGKISLEDSISQYFDGLPADWQNVQIKNLLTHSSGLPDFIYFDSNLSDEDLFSKLFETDMDFQTGAKFSYNQTNYWLLAQIIEKVSGLQFHEFILRNQFSNTRGGVLFSSNAIEAIPNRIGKYNYNKDLESYEIATDNFGTRGHSGNGLNITLHEFIQWSQNFDNDSIISEETKSLMWSRFGYDNKKDSFLYGWGIYPINGKESYGFSGGGVSGFRKFIEEDLTIIVLTNGYKYYPVQDDIITHIGGLVDDDLVDRGKVIEQEVIARFLQQENINVKSLYQQVKEKAPALNVEKIFNSIGYKLLALNQIKEAIEVFKLNVLENPESSNAYDSLAESYLYDDQLDLSIENYKRSIELNPENTHAVQMIERIRSRIANIN